VESGVRFRDDRKKGKKKEGRGLSVLHRCGEISLKKGRGLVISLGGGAKQRGKRS